MGTCGHSCWCKCSYKYFLMSTHEHSCRLISSHEPSWVLVRTYKDLWDIMRYFNHFLQPCLCQTYASFKMYLHQFLILGCYIDHNKSITASCALQLTHLFSLKWELRWSSHAFWPTSLLAHRFALLAFDREVLIHHWNKGCLWPG